ncbi:protein FAR1-RELATED SEQUENCE 3-like [Dioscorea cayenensis subsp. rotundata]|uniref:Protein FAR1-RELATED SEQUENCE 3-like n=1 Tax=Dioscorea cayennensis subsp. rotundata TaxID=55577 RepID=A0AB40B5K3_DIOCR|nr:protein FAR1-RELATED SEQUENCE 3-like [Dioscorea cayenensis subsp. rotundata]
MSIAAYEAFGDVISFNTTYLTNKYDMPFAPFVGVNHHGQTILFGCGLLSKEDTKTYIWLFNTWLECMAGKAPKVIITDQCMAIQDAVKAVFPNSHHRLCLWHIMKKVPEKLGGLNEYKAIKKVLKSIIYEAMDIQEFKILAAEIGAQSIEKYNFLMKFVDGAIEKLMDDTNYWESHPKQHSLEVDHEQHQATSSTTKFRTPLKVRTKGRPPLKRKKSKVEELIIRNKKKVNSNSLPNALNMYVASFTLQNIGTDSSSQVTRKLYFNTYDLDD